MRNLNVFINWYNLKNKCNKIFVIKHQGNTNGFSQRGHSAEKKHGVTFIVNNN